MIIKAYADFKKAKKYEWNLVICHWKVIDIDISTDKLTENSREILYCGYKCYIDIIIFFK